MSRIECVFLSIQLVKHVCILLFSIHQEVFLVINLISEGGDHVNVNLHSGSVVILHSSFFVCDSVEGLLKFEELILEILVLTLSSSEVHGLLPQLCNESVLVVLSTGLVVKIPIWAL